MAYAQQKGQQWHANYWNENKHGSAWQRVREAMKRDWTQTKADFGAKSGRDLDQDAGDTVKQAAGKEPIPGDFESNESAISYGFGAREEYGQKYDQWNPDLENQLRTEWDKDQTGMEFDTAKPFVRRGWEYRKEK